MKKKKTKCFICDTPTDGKMIVRTTAVSQPIVVCSSCLNDWGNERYENLTKKLEKSMEKL
jgi:ribosome-binding protein aMBF1 (putative translation factor)